MRQHRVGRMFMAKKAHKRSNMHIRMRTTAYKMRQWFLNIQETQFASTTSDNNTHSQRRTEDQAKTFHT